MKVAKKSNQVAEDVITKKYGSIAGKAVGNAGDSLYNVFRSVKLLSLLNPQTMIGAVARETGKNKIKKEDDAVVANLGSEEVFYRHYF